eukprot:4684957-Ditylum_brightwellii.AAC.1
MVLRTVKRSVVKHPKSRNLWQICAVWILGQQRDEPQSGCSLVTKYFVLFSEMGGRGVTYIYGPT